MTKNDKKLEDSEVGETIYFSAEGENHRLWISTKGNNVEVMVASTPMSVGDRLKKWEDELHNLPKEEQVKAKRGVLIHPGDLGMEAIASEMFNALGL